MEELLKQLLAEVSGIRTEIAEIKAEQKTTSKRLDSLEQQVTDMRDSQVHSEQTITKQIGSLLESQEIIMEIAKDSRELMRDMKKTLEQYDSDKVAVDLTLTDHEQRITAVEKIAV